MKLQTLRAHHCPACCSLLVLDETHTVITVGDCPVCEKNVRFNIFALVFDTTHLKVPVFDKDAAIKRFTKKLDETPAEKPEKKAPKQKTCGKCGLPGHNARTCKEHKRKDSSNRAKAAKQTKATIMEFLTDMENIKYSADKVAEHCNIPEDFCQEVLDALVAEDKLEMKDGLYVYINSSMSDHFKEDK